MSRLAQATVAITVVLSMTAAYCAQFVIPKDQFDPKKVFCGRPSGFKKPGEVDLKEVIMATPECEEIKKNRIQSGTGKYAILLSKATTRAVNAIKKVAKETDFDLIAAKGYLGVLKPPIPAKDITELVIEAMKEKE